MAVMVMGGAGYIGSHMVLELLDAGEDVVVIDDLSTGFEWAVAPEAKLVVGDVADRELIAGVIREHGIDAIIHFAGSVIVPESVVDPLAYYENNTCKTRSLIEAAVRGGVQNFIFSSTAAVYGGSRLEPVTEDAATIPDSPYGLSKLMSEWMLRDAAAAYGLCYSALRYFNVAGADPHGRSGQSTFGATHLIKVACEAALGKRTSIQVFGTDYPTPDGTCVRDYIHVSDLVDVHRRALHRMRNGGGNLVANCGYSLGYSVFEVIDSVRRVFGRDFKVEIGDRRPGDAISVVANSDLLRRELMWVPKFDKIDTIVTNALEWEQRLIQRSL